MGERPIAVSALHPYAEALKLAESEFVSGEQALGITNEGRARVCGRRAVGIFIQTISSHLHVDYGSHAMANLRNIEADGSLPDEIRSAAARLLGGARSISASKAFSEDPLSDAARIINYFVAATE